MTPKVLSNVHFHPPFFRSAIVRVSGTTKTFPFHGLRASMAYEGRNLLDGGSEGAGKRGIKKKTKGVKGKRKRKSSRFECRT